MRRLSTIEIKKIKRLWVKYPYATTEFIARKTKWSPPTVRIHYPFKDYGMHFSGSQVAHCLDLHPNASDQGIAAKVRRYISTVRKVRKKMDAMEHKRRMSPEKAAWPMPNPAELNLVRLKKLATTKPDGGTKHDDGKLPYDLIAPELLSSIALVLQHGEKKYGRRNWEKGMRWGRPFAAMMRHMWDWWCGDKLDRDSGLSHLAHAACCLMFLIAYEERKIGTDDRGE